VSQHTPEELAETFAELARELQAADGLDPTLERICELAVELVDGCEHAGLSMVRGRVIETPAASSDVPPRVDAIQYETGQGPCLDAIRDHEMIRVDDLSSEQRWPDFAARAAAETGVHSMLSFRLFVLEDTMGALNLYAAAPAAFPATAEPLGAVLAAHAAVAVSGARERDQIGHLEHAQHSNREIGKAIGILMAGRGLTGDDAFNLLRGASNRSNVKLRELADQVVDRHERQVRAHAGTPAPHARQP
jgi:transcriptional regulator with GAF, ATPase, and Fis domain